jgi:hypothetical protein
MAKFDEIKLHALYRFNYTGGSIDEPSIVEEMWTHHGKLVKPIRLKKEGGWMMFIAQTKENVTFACYAHELVPVTAPVMGEPGFVLVSPNDNKPKKKQKSAGGFVTSKKARRLQREIDRANAAYERQQKREAKAAAKAAKREAEEAAAKRCDAAGCPCVPCACDPPRCMNIELSVVNTLEADNGAA